MRHHLPTRPRRAVRHSEEGYILIGVMILLAVFIIAMGVAAPKMAADIQRDRDVETMHRGKQYIRAIQLYYRKFNAYPPSLDALVKTNDIRFLRKKYIDPTTGKDDWKPIMYCQNKTPMAMGFFGQPLAGATGCGTLAGIGPSGGNGLNGTSGSNQLFPTQGNSGSSDSGTSGTTSAPGGSTTTPAGGTPGAATGSTDQSGGNTNAGAQTFGGGGIVGVSPMSPKQSIYVYKKKNHYNEWEFLYSPLSDQQTITGGNAGALGGTGTGIGGTGIGGSGIGGGASGGSGTGTTGNTGNSGTSGTTTPPPTQ